MPTSLLTVTPLTASGISHVFDNIPYGPIAWFDAAKISGISSGVSLSAWTDVSGNGNHLTATSVASQPVYVTSPRAGVRFNGVANFMQVAYTLNQPCSTVIVFTGPTTSAGGNFTLHDGGAVRALINTNAAGSFSINAGTGSAGLTSSGTGAPRFGCIVWNGSSTTESLDTQSSTVAAGANNPGGTRIGITLTSSQTWPGDVHEIASYNRALTADEIALFRTYAQAKWATP